MAPIVVAFGLVGIPGTGFSLVGTSMRSAILLGGAGFFSARLAGLRSAAALGILVGIGGTLLWSSDGGGVFYLAPLAVILLATRPDHRSTWALRIVLGLIATGGARALVLWIPFGGQGEMAAMAIATAAAFGVSIADRAGALASPTKNAPAGPQEPAQLGGCLGTGIAAGLIGATAGFALGWIILLAMAGINALSSEPQFGDLGLAALAFIIWPTVIGTIVGVSLAPSLRRRRAQRPQG